MEGPSSQGRAARASIDLGAQLAAIARPRLVGSPAAAEVAAHIRRTLAECGYDLSEYQFQFNPWPARLGVSLAGAGYLISSVWAGASLVAGNGYGALAVLLASLVVMAVAVWSRPLLESAGWALQPGSNLLATPPGTRPSYLVVAHRDSKSQPVPLLLRGPAIALAILSWLWLFLLALFATTQPVPRTLVLSVTAIAAVSAFVLGCCWVANRSPGALDNASGVAVLLGIAQQQRAAGDVAFLVTDAEELGLAGARAVADRLPAVSGAINLDGIDDTGSFHVIERFGWPWRRGGAPELGDSLLRAGQQLELPVRRRDGPFGILLDHMPIADAGIPALTVMKGNARSLRRVHRPADDLDHLDGRGASTAVELVGRALALLRAQEPTGD